MDQALRMNRRSVNSFGDHYWDYAPRAEVRGSLLSRVDAQLRAASATAAFRHSVSRLWQETRGPVSQQSFETLPLLNKAQLRAIPPDDLLVNPRGPFHMVRGTGGTTGQPVSVFWTRADWTAFTQSLSRYCAPLRRASCRRFWNGYNQGHVSGPVFDDLVRVLGGTPIPRHFRSTDAQALADIERVGADALIITPKSGSGKGGSLEDLLAIDPDFLARLRIKALIVSSTPLDAELVEEVRQQGVEAIVNFYGSTEAAPAAASCEADATTFHVSNGHVLVEVVDDRGQQVASGSRGRVVVSRIGAESESGLSPAGGTQLLRYLNGDSAVYDAEPCRCGRTSPRIGAIERVTDLEDKLKGGCERWD